MVALACLGVSHAQTLTVTSPNEDQFLGQSNQIKFLVTGVNVEVTISAEVVGPGGTTTISDRFTPNASNEIDGSLPLNFSQAAPEGDYVITVTGKRNDNNVVFGTVVINVKVDVTKPKFMQFNPLNSSFVKGIVPITVKVREPFFQDYRVQINSQDIPNNTGMSLVNDRFVVSWDTNGILQDGQQTISVRLRDLANNEENLSVTATIDRSAPSVTIVQPRANVDLRPRSNVSIAIDVLDASNLSVNGNGVDVFAETLGGQFITRAARQGFRAQNGTTSRWTGRIRYRGNLPSEFRLVANVVDRAGNVAATQSVIVRYN